MMEQILSTLGLALRAGSVAVGEEPVGSAARAKHARLILVASDAAPGSVRRAFAFAQTGACLCLVIPAEKAALGRALGRTSCAMCAVTDIGFAGALGKKLAALDPAHFAEASGRLEIKAQRAAQRREEQQRHEKNVREGRRRKAPPPPPKGPDAPPPREPKPAPKRAARPKPGAPGGKAPGARPPRGGKPRPGAKPAQRWAGSRPVKKGKGSDRGDKK